MLTTPCHGPDPCGHSNEEHIAFDRGYADGNAGKELDENPYRESNLREAWWSGQSVGVGDYNEELGEKE